MTNINSQAVLQGQEQRYGKVFRPTYKSWLKRYKEILFDNGIKTVIFPSPSEVIPLEVAYPNLTLLILPNIRGLNKLPTAQISGSINNYVAIIYPAYEPIDSTLQRISITQNNIQIPILDFYKEKNLIILYYNPFPFTPRVKQFELIIRHISQSIRINLSQQPQQTISRLSPEELKKQNIKLNVDAFINNVKKSYIQLQRDLEQRRRDIDNAGVIIVNAYKDIDVKTAQLESIKKIVDGVDNGFEDKVNELKSLPFIKDVEILRTGIKLDYGEIYIDNVYIGKMYCIINPTEIKFFNVDNAINTYAHPHVSSGNPCFGNSSTQMYKLLGIMDFKQLGYLIGQFLRTYSEKGHPYIKLSEWKKLEKK